MEKRTGTVSGKIILSGEYAVVFGYPGIAIPAPFGVTTVWGSPSPQPLSHGERGAKHHDMTISYRGIENEAYLHHILNEIQKYTSPLSGHLTIENHIPIGRGMGSSTALVIAIARCLIERRAGKTRVTLSSDEGRHARCHGSTELTMTPKDIALSIEDTVNPGHSGLDFEVIWNEKPTIFQKGKPPQILDITINRLMGTFASSVLIDTGKPNETTPEMVAWVKENSLSPRERVRVRGALHTIAHCTERLLTVSRETCHPERSRGALYEIFRDHHRAQITLGVVPEPVQALIADIEKIGGVAKVVGAGGRTGGAGIVLALHQKPQKILTIAQQHGMQAWVESGPKN